VPTLNNVENTDYWTAYVPNVLNYPDGAPPTGDSTDDDGYYYTWDAAMTVCTDPWRLPSVSDFGNLLAAAPIDFNAKAAGQIHQTAKAFNRGLYAFWWSSTTDTSSPFSPFYNYWENWNNTATYDTTFKESGYSVRCVKDI
jgi:hypothetical protein